MGPACSGLTLPVKMIGMERKQLGTAPGSYGFGKSMNKKAPSSLWEGAKVWAPEQSYSHSPRSLPCLATISLPSADPRPVASSLVPAGRLSLTVYPLP